MNEQTTFEMKVASDNNKITWVIAIMIVVALGAYSYTTIKAANYLSPNTASISVMGEAEVKAVPDIAEFSFSVLAEASDVQSARDESATAINEILAYLGDEGIAETDITTENYRLNPRYDYINSVCSRDGHCPPGERILRGYEVSQTVRVKVRDTETVGALISGVGERGATNISSLRFTIDDEEALEDEAREAAITDAKAKAKALARELDVDIVRVMSFNEEGGYEPYYRNETMAMDASEGLGGAVAPSIPAGENTISSRVHITYEVR